MTFKVIEGLLILKVIEGYRRLFILVSCTVSEILQVLVLLVTSVFRHIFRGVPVPSDRRCSSQCERVP